MCVRKGYGKLVKGREYCVGVFVGTKVPFVSEV